MPGVEWCEMVPETCCGVTGDASGEFRPSPPRNFGRDAVGDAGDATDGTDGKTSVEMLGKVSVEMVGGVAFFDRPTALAMAAPKERERGRAAKNPGRGPAAASIVGGTTSGGIGEVKLRLGVGKRDGTERMFSKSSGMGGGGGGAAPDRGDLDRCSGVTGEVRPLLVLGGRPKPRPLRDAPPEPASPMANVMGTGPRATRKSASIRPTSVSPLGRPPPSETDRCASTA